MATTDREGDRQADIQTNTPLHRQLNSLFTVQTQTLCQKYRKESSLANFAQVQCRLRLSLLSATHELAATLLVLSNTGSLTFEFGAPWRMSYVCRALPLLANWLQTVIQCAPKASSQDIELELVAFCCDALAPAALFWFYEWKQSACSNLFVRRVAQAELRAPWHGKTSALDSVRSTRRGAAVVNTHGRWK